MAIPSGGGATRPVARSAAPTRSRVTYVLARPAATGGAGSSTGTGDAAAQAQAILGPQLAQQDLYATHQNAVIQSFARALLGKLQPVAGQVGADYDKAIQQIGGLSGQAAQYLSGQNPTAVQQALQSNAGAPPEQQAQAAQALGNVFQGGAGVLAYTGGTIPGSELAANKAAAQSSARQLPGIAALKGQQDLASALWQQSTDRQKLEATRPGLVQDAQTAIDTNAYRNATLAQSAANTKERASEFAATQRNNLVIANAKASAPQTPYRVSPGQTIIDPRTGKVLYQAPSSSSSTSSRPITYQDGTGREFALDPATGRVTQLPGAPTPPKVATPKTPTPHYTTVTDSTGTYVVNEDTGARRRVAGPSASSSRPSVSIVGDSTTGRSRAVTYPNGKIVVTPLPGRLGKPSPAATAAKKTGGRSDSEVRQDVKGAVGIAEKAQGQTVLGKQVGGDTFPQAYSRVVSYLVSLGYKGPEAKRLALQAMGAAGWGVPGQVDAAP
jgi:hypothetical protein